MSQNSIPERVTVLTNHGVPLYDYLPSHMENTLCEDLIFSAIISGISSALSVGLNCGQIKEIKLEDATILFHRDEIKSLIFLVIAKKITLNTRRSLLKFSKNENNMIIIPK